MSILSTDDNSLINGINSLGTFRRVPRGTFLFRQGDSAGNFFWFQEGLAKACYETVDGKEFVKTFIREGECIASIQALATNKANSFSLLTLEPSAVVEVPRAGLMQLMEADPAFAQSINKVLIQLALKKERREYELLCMTAEERLVAFYEGEIDLVRRVSQNDQAAYLGITPVALSRIRKRTGV